MRWLFVALVLVGLVDVGCGAKVAGSGDNPEGGSAEGTHGAGPPPTCSAVCDHIVGICAPGANTDSCVADCEKENERLTGCMAELAALYRCMLTTRVNCASDQLVIIDCSEERIAVEACATR